MDSSTKRLAPDPCTRAVFLHYGSVVEVMCLHSRKASDLGLHGQLPVKPADTGVQELECLVAFADDVNLGVLERTGAWFRKSWMTLWTRAVEMGHKCKNVEGKVMPLGLFISSICGLRGVCCQDRQDK
ncbi:hypothetical protein Y1Q_0016302 [Alligator mississippiensis]|uniref:Uncharacterized protein n=1 Tax=Alligator mississippiensis TaxID=8496 RepID=A0A151MYL9_ALLMI|nr:hypothetical protein Y1Q_0016302 [Alligator mississippiensis]